MRRKIGTLLMSLGTLCILSSLGLLIYVQLEAAAAEKASAALTPMLISEIEARQTFLESELSSSDTTPTDLPMPSVTIDGQDYIGYLIIPTLERELPVMADWSYTKLRSAPCRFSGTLAGNDLVVMAHNYTKHFGSLRTLSAGDPIYFRDADGFITEYAVAAIETLAPTDVEKMTAGDYALTLFTCTYSRQSRVTVRCDRV